MKENAPILKWGACIMNMKALLLKIKITALEICYQEGLSNLHALLLWITAHQTTI